MKQPNWKTPLILSGVVGLLGLGAYWLEFKDKPNREKKETLSKKPMGFLDDKTQFSQVRVKGTFGLFEFKCKDLITKTCTSQDQGVWELSHPLAERADGENVKSFLNSVTSTVAANVIDLREDTPEKRTALMKEYGLDEAARTSGNLDFIELTLESGSKKTLYWGAEFPTGDQHFVGVATDGKFDDQTIYVMNNYFDSNLKRNLTYFRDKDLFKFNRDEIVKAEGVIGSEKWSVEKKDQKWFLNSTTPGDYERIATLFQSINNLKAKEFVDEKVVKMTLSKEMSFKLWDSKNQEIRLDYFTVKTGKKDGSKSIYARSSERPGLFEVDAETRQGIQKSAKDLWKSSLFNASELLPFSELKLTRTFAKDSRLKANEEFIRPKTDDKASALFGSLQTSKIKGWMKNFPTGQPEAKFSLKLGKDNENPVTLEFQVHKSGIFAEFPGQNPSQIVQLEDNFKGSLPLTEDAWNPTKAKP